MLMSQMISKQIQHNYYCKNHFQNFNAIPLISSKISGFLDSEWNESPTKTWLGSKILHEDQFKYSSESVDS